MLENENVVVKTKKLFSIYDEKCTNFNAPFCSQVENEAVRHFGSLLLDDNSMVAKFPQDFKLYYLGDINEVTGVINPLSIPTLIVSGAELKDIIVKESL